ncbi:MAG: hypothetical protein ACRD1E_06055 [Terriglobales bacterium]
MIPRIGNDTDDFCPRCRRLTDHTVAALVGDQIASTACHTCGFQHPYRGGKLPARSAKSKPTAFDQVLAGILGEQPAAPEAAPKPAPKPARKRKP